MTTPAASLPGPGLSVERTKIRSCLSVRRSEWCKIETPTYHISISYGNHIPKRIRLFLLDISPDQVHLRGAQKNANKSSNTGVIRYNEDLLELPLIIPSCGITSHYESYIWPDTVFLQVYLPKTEPSIFIHIAMYFSNRKYPSFFATFNHIISTILAR